MHDAIDWKEIQEALSAPFEEKEISWRAGSTNGEKTRAMALAYIDARNVMDRLDAIIGPGSWSDDYRVLPDGKHVECALTIFGVTKVDVGEPSGGGQADEIKGAYSDAFKRAAVKWGIGRYLYALDSPWVACRQVGRSVILTETPRLPAWALPKVNRGTTQAAQPPASLTPAPAPAQAPATQPVTQSENFRTIWDSFTDAQKDAYSATDEEDNLAMVVAEYVPRYKNNIHAARAALRKVNGGNVPPLESNREDGIKRVELFDSVVAYAAIRDDEDKKAAAKKKPAARKTKAATPDDPVLDDDLF